MTEAEANEYEMLIDYFQWGTFKFLARLANKTRK